MRNIYLVGFMGTGKTAVGRALAKKLKVQLVDIDDLIVKKENRSINDIFSQSKEPYFRKLEQETLREIALGNGQIVACGGGIVINPDNIAIMKKSGTMIALTARPEIIYERVKRASHRPLLKVADPLEKIKELLALRKPYYEQAHVVIDTSALSVQEVMRHILDWVNSHD